MATRVRDWAGEDLYGLLGVGADATGDDIARAFRRAAKQAHPDATGDPEAVERFKRLAAAYAVLSDRRSRREYDHARTHHAVTSVPAAAVPARTVPRPRWTRGRAWAALVAGIVVTACGLVAAGVTWGLRQSDADRRARFVAVTAERVPGGRIVFDTLAGRRVITREPTRHGDPTGRDRTVRVRYDPDDPRRTMLDSSTLARDITLAIVAVKFVVGGAVFVVLGARHLGPVRPKVAR